MLQYIVHNIIKKPELFITLSNITRNILILFIEFLRIDQVSTWKYKNGPFMFK